MSVNPKPKPIATAPTLLQSKFMEVEDSHTDTFKTMEACTEACDFGTTDDAVPFACTI